MCVSPGEPTLSIYRGYSLFRSCIYSMSILSTWPATFLLEYGRRSRPFSLPARGSPRFKAGRRYRETGSQSSSNGHRGHFLPCFLRSILRQGTFVRPLGGERATHNHDLQPSTPTALPQASATTMTWAARPVTLLVRATGVRGGSFRWRGGHAGQLLAHSWFSGRRVPAPDGAPRPARVKVATSRR